MDVEKFINLIQSCKCLWDQNDPSYHLRDLQRKAWKQISEEMKISVEDLKKKWRGLRDTFGKELKKVNTKKSGQAPTETASKWPYYKLLLFLRNTMSRRDLKGSIPDTCPISDEEDITNVNVNSPPPPSPGQSSNDETPKNIFKSPLKNKVKKRQLNEMDTRLLQIEEEKLQCFKQNTNDPDAQFLMSLLPFLKDTPKHRKLIVRSKLQQVFIDEEQ